MAAVWVMLSVGSGENLHCQSVLMSQRGREFPICVGLSEQGIGLGLESLYGISTSGEAGWRFFEPGEMNECVGELGRVAPLLSVLSARPR
jgi:hypothetical protein